MDEEQKIVQEMKEQARRKEAEKRLGQKHQTFTDLTNAEVLLLQDTPIKEKPFAIPELSIEDVAKELGAEVYINSRGEKDLKFPKKKEHKREFYG